MLGVGLGLWARWGAGAPGGCEQGVAGSNRRGYLCIELGGAALCAVPSSGGCPAAGRGREVTRGGSGVRRELLEKCLQQSVGSCLQGLVNR